MESPVEAEDGVEIRSIQHRNAEAAKHVSSRHTLTTIIERTVKRYKQQLSKYPSNKSPAAGVAHDLPRNVACYWYKSLATWTSNGMLNSTSVTHTFAPAGSVRRARTACLVALPGNECQGEGPALLGSSRHMWYQYSWTSKASHKPTSTIKACELLVNNFRHSR